MGTVIVVVVVIVCAVAGFAVWTAVGALRRWLENRLAATDAELRRLGDASVWRERGTSEVRQEMAGLRTELERVRARDEERRRMDEERWQTLQRVAAVLTGGQRAGRTGENVLREALGHLPPDMVETNFRVNGGVVEFGLVLPDGRRLPIDSKWSADAELQALAEAADPAERDRLVAVVEKAVARRAREVATYLDPAVTASVGVAAVPDAVYGVLRRAHADAYRQGVIVTSYSMAPPLVLFLYSLVSRYGTSGDVEGCLNGLAGLLDAMEATLENRVVRASTMLQNGAEELRGQVAKARSTLGRARSVAGSAGDDPPLLPDDEPEVRLAWAARSAG